MKRGGAAFILTVASGRTSRSGCFGSEYSGDPDSRRRRGDHGHPRLQSLPQRLRGEPGDERQRSLEAGADDYVTKPFGMKELVARINANLKRSETGGRGKIIEAGDLQLDTKNFTVRVAGDPMELRLKEFELLAALASTPGELRSREGLAKEVWGHAGVGSSRTIDVHIRRIRASLEERSSYEFIHTARGLGYRFEAKPRSTALATRRE